MRPVLRATLLIVACFALAAPLLAQPNTACGNGSFEPALDAGEWFGGHGYVLRNGEPHFGSFTVGLIPGMSNGALNAASSHQTWVDAADLDPLVGISRVAPGGSTHAMRIGNSVCDAHADMLAKTFIVRAEQSVIRFSYAAVLEHGAGHSPAQESSFWVRVLDASGAVLPGVVHLAGVSDKLIAGDSSLVQKPGTDVFYRDWTRASIDLSRYVGRTVTVQFITEDCSLGGHFAYAYVDNFCESGCGASLELVLPTVDCGAGDVCVHYTLPEIAGVLGCATIRLDMLQGGETVSSMTAVVTGGTSHCFTIDPKALPLSATYPGGFDFVATATFSTCDASCDVRSVGSSTEGILPGQDNDHYVGCGTPSCASGFNAIANGDFEAGDRGFISDYAFADVSERLLPGQYSVLSAAEVGAKFCLANAISCDARGSVLVVNGDTGESRSRKVWSQTVPVIGGRDYRFCASFRNLPRYGFDVQPKVEIRFSTSDDRTAIVIDRTSDPCDWQQVERTIRTGNGDTTLTCEIWLDESEPGDGNDVAIDNIGLYRQ